MQCVRRIAQPALRLTRRSHHEAPDLGISYNDLLKPSGNFQELNSKKQAKYNMLMVAGVAFFIGSVGAVKGMGMLEVVGPPKMGN